MRKDNIYKYVTIGGSITWYRSANENYNVDGHNGLIKSLTDFENLIDELNLNVTYRAAAELFKFNKRLQTENTSNLTSELCVELTRITTELLPTLKAEIKGHEVFLVNDKRYSIEKLTSKINKLFAPDVYFSLPEIAQYDISESGKCLLYEVPTAAAFHILRATESILKKYYKKFLRKKSDGKTWGQLINELTNKNRGKLPNAVTINHLRNIKDSYRNPTQHPEKVYDIDEVQDLFNLCVDVINKMSNEIK